MSENIQGTQLDRLDYQIIQELRKDGRSRVAQIARAVHANERTVRNRVDRLVAQGVIHLAAIINPRAFGYITVAEIFLDVAPAQEDDVIKHLLEMQEIIYLAYGFGERDILIQACFKDNGEMRDFLRKILPAIPGVKVTGSTLIPRVLRTADEWMPKAEDFQARFNYNNGIYPHFSKEKTNPIGT